MDPSLLIRSEVPRARGARRCLQAHAISCRNKLCSDNVLEVFQR